MRLRLCKLQENNKEAKVLIDFFGLLKDWKDIEGELQYRKRPYVLEVICFEVIICHHNDLLVAHFGIDKTRKLVGRKYYWPSLRKNVEAYMKGCDICLTSKAVKHKPYRDLQSLPVPTH